MIIYIKTRTQVALKTADESAEADRNQTEINFNVTAQPGEPKEPAALGDGNGDGDIQDADFEIIPEDEYQVPESGLENTRSCCCDATVHRKNPKFPKSPLICDSCGKVCDTQESEPVPA